jgi:peptidoglycan/LPS O-acetylase OafA/YrhL
MIPTSTTDTAAHAGTGPLRYSPGLDGVRALAVTAVVAYHIGTTSGAAVLPGGFLGVDVFFALSGYLITSLLIVEARQQGRISIRQFYIRRARRLLPALFAVLLAVGAIGAIWLPQQAARTRGDLLAALGYVTNWWLITQNSSYFAPGGDRPNLLTHLWSLAVEEQYYLIWPLVLTAFFLIRAPRWLVLSVVLAGVAASTTAAVLLYDPFADPSRVYYGTDTRALAPLAGAALALIVQPWSHRTRLPRATRYAVDTLGIAALLALTVVAATLTDTHRALYGAGFLGIAALGAVVIAVAGHPATALGGILGRPPLRWLGERSYGIYLWHWPVCVLTRPGTDVPLTGWANAGLRIALALVLADLSYRLVERPIRVHGFIAPLRMLGTTRLRDRQVSRAVVVRVTMLTLVMLGGGTAVGLQLSAEATRPVAGGPVDLGPAQSIGKLATMSPTPMPAGRATPPPLPAHPKVAFYGDSQAMTLLINKPDDIGTYLTVVDDTIEGCGVLLGKVASSSGEKRNLTADCRDWASAWTSKVAATRPDLAIVMIGAWDVFDLTLDSGQTLPFASPAWDANFQSQVSQGVGILRSGGAQVALALLPCYHPIQASAGLWPERGDNVRTRHINDLLRAVAAKDPDSRVRTVDPPSQFCTDPAIGADTAYRWDGVHYYKKGAALYFAALVPQLLPPAPVVTPSATPGASAGPA